MNMGRRLRTEMGMEVFILCLGEVGIVVVAVNPEA